MTPDEANLLRELEEVVARIDRRRQQLAEDEARRDAIMLQLLRGRPAPAAEPPAPAQPPAPVASRDPAPPPSGEAQVERKTVLFAVSFEVERLLDLAAGHDGPFSPAEMAEDMKRKPSTVRGLFSQAVAAGRIRCVSHGLYELTPAQREASAPKPPADAS